MGGKEIKAIIYLNGVEIEGFIDTVLIASGRTANIENLKCETAGIRCDNSGILVANTLKSSNSNVYACGDCVSGPNFSHNFENQSRIVIKNSLFKFSDEFELF